MANEIKVAYASGRTLYFVVLNAAGQAYNGSAFEALSAANWANYRLAMTEAAAGTGVYLGNFPAAAAGRYAVVACCQVGASAAPGDPRVRAGDFDWTGSAEATDASPTNMTVDMTEIRG